jgi:hypothetical protein
MSKYYFKNFKKNIFFIIYDDNENNIHFKKLIKIPVTLDINKTIKEYDINNKIFNDINNNNNNNNNNFSEYFTKVIDYFCFKNIFLFNNIILCTKIDNNEIIIKFNILNLIEENILTLNFIQNNFEIENNYSKDIKYIIINKISFLLIDYYEESITLYKYLSYNDISIYEKIVCLKNCLKNLYVIHNELNLIHGDFKTNNIIYLFNNFKIKFIDLEFSYIFNNENKYIIIDDIYEINLYLNIKEKKTKLHINFLKFFDIYIFTLSFFVLNKKNTNKFIFQQLMNEINYYYEFYFYIFIIIFYILLIYSENNNLELQDIHNKEFHKLCNYDNIFSIIYDKLFSIKNVKFKDSIEWIYNVFFIY